MVVAGESQVLGKNEAIKYTVDFNVWLGKMLLVYILVLRLFFIILLWKHCRFLLI